MLRAQTKTFTQLDAAAAANLEAIAEEILPGARDAGVIVFIDRALAGYDHDKQEIYRTGLAEARAKRTALVPGSTNFAGLTSPQRIALLKAMEQTEFFRQVRIHTILGSFGHPKHGGNRGFASAQLLGIETSMPLRPSEVDVYRAALINDPKKQPAPFRSTPEETAKRQPCIEYARPVGGGSVHFSANYWRFHPDDFRERSMLGSVPGADLQDWPITYEELEPYYTKAEWELGVSGLAAANPFEGPRSKPYPLPPMPVKGSVVRSLRLRDERQV